MNDAQRAAWPDYCKRLEALGVDPYTPTVPKDDHRHAQVQAIVAEFNALLRPPISLPPDWEGHPPLRSLDALAAVADWLMDELTSVVATKLGGEKYHADALTRAQRAMRNAYRVLTHLRVADRPDRPPPAETLAEGVRQLEDLRRCVRNKLKGGWKPTPVDAQVKADADAVANIQGEITPDHTNQLHQNDLPASPAPPCPLDPVVEAENFTVRWRDKTCFLGLTNEFRLFRCLHGRLNKFVSTETIVGEVWTGCETEENTVQKTVSNLRKKLRAAGMMDKKTQRKAEADEKPGEAERTYLSIASQPDHYALLLPG